jgi:Ran GTPase-activating protein (RanGAP) involved in mRNA processing and transport
MMKTKEDLIATCQALQKNDPRHTKLDLSEYSSLVGWKKQARKVAEVLEDNTVVEDLTLPYHLCAESAFQLSHFLKSSPSLRRLEMTGKGQETEEVRREIESLKTSIVIESISRSNSLVKLRLKNIVFGENCPLEGFLSSTRTLLDFSYVQNDSTMKYGTAQAIGRGFAKNMSLETLRWQTPVGLDFMEEVLFGLLDHINLKSIILRTQLTRSSSQALRSLLHCNKTLERFELALFSSEEEFPTMAPVLAGLAQNTGLKKVVIRSESSETDMTLATAWTDMLQRNTSIQMLDLNDDDWEGDSDYRLCSAVAAGLANNSTLISLCLPREDSFSSEDSLFNGPVWQEMLKSNHSLKSLSFTKCVISVEGFQCLARGLSCNTSLETLDLSHTDMGDLGVIALVDGLGINKTLEVLDLSYNCVLTQSGRDAIGRLMCYNVLRELMLADTEESVCASILASGLSDNHSLEKLNLQSAFRGSEGPETFLALCESLRGNTTLRYLNVRGNDVPLDEVCTTALKLDTMSLETLDLDYSDLTSCGIAALAEGLQGPCTLKELTLMACELDDPGLLLLGEALTTNDTLEVLDVRSNNFTHSGASQFFDLLSQMKGLKSVYGLVNKRNGVAPTEAFGMALVDGVRENTKLQKIFADDDVASVDSSFPPGLAREIKFYLELNRHGRMLLRLSGRSELPSGLWPRVLAKLSSPRDTSLLFYFLQSKPKIVKCKAAASQAIVPCRSRPPSSCTDTFMVKSYIILKNAFWKRLVQFSKCLEDS